MPPEPTPDTPRDGVGQAAAAARERRIRRTGIAAVFVVGLAVTFMTGDYLVELVGSAPAKARIAKLEEDVRNDSDIAKLLDDERKAITDASLARMDRARVLAWVVLVAGVVAVACGKWLATRRAQPLPDLDALVAVRFPPASPREATSRAADEGGAAAPTEAPTEIAGAVPSAPAAAAAAHEIDLAFVDQLVARHGRGREAAIPILQEIQAHWRYLPDEAMRRVCALTEITPAQLAGTSSFYARFRRSPVGLHLVRVCHGTACHVAGATRITDELRRHLEIAPGEDTDPLRRFTLEEVACVGCCSLAPVMMIEEETAGRLTPASARSVLESLEPSA